MNTASILVKGALVLIFTIYCNTVEAQLTDPTSRKINPNGAPTNIERYGLDYELIEYTFVNGDSTILGSLDLRSMEYLRHDTMDQVYRDHNNLVNVLLYSRERIKNGDVLELNEEN